MLSKTNAAVLLFTAAVEWLTQRHLLDASREDEALDGFTMDVFRAHWEEECQPAQLDHLETLRAFEGLSAEERDRAIDELIELVGAVDGLLRVQTEHDLENLARALGRSLAPAETEELRGGVLAAKRWTFIESGVTHPRFQELFREVTNPAQRERVEQALGDLLAPARC